MKQNKLLQVERWGALWHTKNKLDGEVTHIIFENYLPVMFVTKREAKEYIKKRYGYIAGRKDLRQEPFRWRMTKPVKLKISV